MRVAGITARGEPVEKFGHLLDDKTAAPKALWTRHQPLS
jgi:hypothetical protein